MKLYTLPSKTVIISGLLLLFGSNLLWGFPLENKQLFMRVETLEKECNRLETYVNLLKRLKNSDLLQQNEALQLKLQAQEDDFSLQNQTLLKELASLVRENEKLRSANAAESSSEAVDEVKKLRAEASALQRALSEERLRSAQENSKLKAILNIFTEGVDKEIINEICREMEHEMNESQEGSGSSGSFLKDNDDFNSEVMLVDKDEGKAEKRENNETVPLNEYMAVQNELARVKGELDMLKGNYGMEILKLAEALQSKKEKLLGLEEALCGVKQRFNECRSISDQRIFELEQSLELLIGEREAQAGLLDINNQKRAELEAQVQQLKKQMTENIMKSEVVHSQLLESINKTKQLNNHMSSMQAEIEQLTNSMTELKMETEVKGHIIDRMTADKTQLIAEYDNKIHHLENEKNLIEYKHKEAVENLERQKCTYEILEKASNLKDTKLIEQDQQLMDLAAERALNEKKGSVICRDLKRQLASERRRVEKLQEKLREYSDSTTSMKQDSSRGCDADITSISSWSLMSGNMDPQESSAQESSLVAGSPVNINGNIFPQSDETDLEQENRNLLERVTALQEGKWVLEEKINHLEQGSAAMAEDLMKKSDVIQFYCMEGRPVVDPQPSSAGRKTVKKISEFLKSSEEEHLQESNTRMQRMLEELLTKNMYLQRDIEQVTKELESLRQALKEKEVC